jgi:hypothetical protein
MKRRKRRQRDERQRRHGIDHRRGERERGRSRRTNSSRRRRRLGTGWRGSRCNAEARGGQHLMDGLVLVVGGQRAHDDTELDVRCTSLHQHLRTRISRRRNTDPSIACLRIVLNMRSELLSGRISRCSRPMLAEWGGLVKSTSALHHHA